MALAGAGFMADVYFKCACGKRLAVDAAAVGRVLSCPDCAARIEIPAPDFEWACPACGAPLSAPEEMRGLEVQCVNCQTAVRAPGPETPPPGLSLKKDAAPPADPAAGRFNHMIMACPQCQEQIPVNTQVCPFCNFTFTKSKPKGIVVGALVGVIVAGVCLGLWRAEIWPFASARPAASGPAPAAVPAEPSAPSNAVAAAPVPEPAGTSAPPAAAASNAPAAPTPSARAATQSDWQERFKPARQFVAAQLDREAPRCASNLPVSLRQMDGIMVHGAHAGVQDAFIRVLVNAKPEIVALQNLDVPSRLTVDEEFRGTWIDVQAAALSRWSLEQSGITVPGLASNRDDLMDAALALGDPRALYQAGQQCYKQKNYAYAVLYLRAAGRNFAPAQYALGMIYCQGIGLGVDRKAGLTWMALAVEQGHSRAQQYVQLHKVSAEALQQLRQQEQTRREREGRDWAALINQARPAADAPGAAALTLAMPVVLTDPATGRSYVYRRGKKVYRE